jgi:hypothetical protein
VSQTTIFLVLFTVFWRIQEKHVEIWSNRSLLYLQASTATLGSRKILKYKLNEHFKRVYKVFLFSKAKATHLGPTQPPRIPRNSGPLSTELSSRGMKLSALFNDDVSTALVTYEWTSTGQRWIDTDDRKSYSNHIPVAMSLLSPQIPQGMAWDWTHASAVRDRTAKSWSLPLTSTHLQLQ